MDNQSLLSEETISNKIYFIRNQKVMLAFDLAMLYDVETKRLNEQVKRNSSRFPEDFMFQLTENEFENLKSQIATSSWGGKRKRPLVFTEHGAVMAATVLSSRKAIDMSVFVVRAFIQMRDALGAHREIKRRLDDLERKVGSQDEAIVRILRALRQLTQPAESPKRRRIGFIQDR